MNIPFYYTPLVAFCQYLRAPLQPIIAADTPAPAAASYPPCFCIVCISAGLSSLFPRLSVSPRGQRARLFFRRARHFARRSNYPQRFGYSARSARRICRFGRIAHAAHAALLRVTPRTPLHFHDALYCFLLHTAKIALSQKDRPPADRSLL